MLPDVAALPEPVRSAVVQREGVASVALLVRAGIPARTVARRVASGRWQRVHRGVVVLQSGALTWHQTAHAALVVAGRSAALSHWSAGFVHRLVGAPGADVVVSVPASRAVRPHAGVVVHRRRTMPSAAGRLRTVDVVGTVLDLVGEAADDDAAVAVVTAALRGGTSARRILAGVDERQNLPRQRLLREVLHDPTLGLESPLEHRYVRDVERAHRLPRSVGQVRQRVDGRWIRADRVHEGVGVRIELDGRLAHPGGTTDSDVWRDNAVLVEHDDVTLRYRWSHVAGSPCAVARQVALALTRAGHPTLAAPCGRCAGGL